MGVMVLIMTVYAVLFATMTCLHFEPTPFVAVSLFFTIVGVSQAALYKGRNPRWASIVTGMALGGLFGLYVSGNHSGEVVACIIWGGLLGYLAGGLIAGVFLLFNKVQPPLEDAQEEPSGVPADDTSWISDRVGELARLAGRYVRRCRVAIWKFAALFPSRKQTGVPRRFGVAVMLVIMTMYAVLFAAMQKLPAVFFICIATFFTGVGLAQTILYKGRDPRRASVVAGMTLYPLLLVVAAFVMVMSGGGHPPDIRDLSRALITLLAVFYFFSGFGALAGYLAGGLIAGVFLLFNKVQTPLEDPEADELDVRQPDVLDPASEGTEPRMDAHQR
jgi:hypothetical protein